MANLFIIAVALVFLVTGFNRVYCIHGINQVYLGLYKGMFDKAVVVVDKDGDYLDEPLFYLPRITAILEEYYETNLTPYCASYDYSVIGRLKDTYGFSMIYCDTVITTFTARINDLETRHKEAVFTVGRSELYE